MRCRYVPGLLALSTQDGHSSPRSVRRARDNGSYGEDQPFEDESAAILGDEDDVQEESEGEDLFRDDMERDYR